MLRGADEIVEQADGRSGGTTILKDGVLSKVTLAMVKTEEAILAAEVGPATTTGALLNSSQL